ncbi:hypothetical protein [Actinoplanes sp. URMC 104]|uniref:hypothetical protein n=1 Tax=Actinoplanes sp. URMC 104 TaxID=3423409 RepID=UPI003F1DC761
MTAPGNEFLIVLLGLSVLLSSAYAFGRMHQWHRRGRERDDAYRTGYDIASRSILSMMAANQQAAQPAPADYRARRGGRHARLHAGSVDRQAA